MAAAKDSVCVVPGGRAVRAIHWPLKRMNGDHRCAGNPPLRALLRESKQAAGRAWHSERMDGHAVMTEREVWRDEPCGDSEKEQMKTLIVEDDMMSQCLLAKVLAERGHEVVSYDNAELAVLAYQKEFYPLLF